MPFNYEVDFTHLFLGMQLCLFDIALFPFVIACSLISSSNTQAQAKIHRAERLLSRIEASMILASPSDDQEMITDEERSVFRRIGLRLKSYLPLGKFLERPPWNMLHRFY